MLQIIKTQLRIGITTLHNSFLKNVARLYTTKYKRETTIYALSSGHGKCGVAVIRISGPNALDSLIKMTKISKLEPRKVFLRKIFDPITGDVIDKGLCLWFPNPHSFTGEDCVEFQVHGGPAIIFALMSALSKLNFQPALPGEFTRRAFYNNKLDLVEIEGLADLIHAETEQQRKQALLQASGHLSKLYNGWREKLARIVANLEAYIDFNENDNIEDNVLQNCNNSIKELLEIIKNHLFDNRRGEILRNGVRIAIIGEPNVGKSTLLNHLVQRNAAIVSPIAGTTRDIIELNTNISGYPVIVADTAGFTKHAKDEIEIEGIRRAKTYTKTANLIVLMIDASKYVNSGKTYKDYIKEYISNMELPDIEISDSEKRQTVVIFNKTDLLTEENKRNLKNDNAIMMSCTAEEGFQDLINQMTIHLRDLCGDAFNETPVISQIRYRIHLSNCVNYLHNYIETSAVEQYDMVIAVEEIRMAMKELGKITGHVSNEEILDIIFKNFCIGK